MTTLDSTLSMIDMLAQRYSIVRADIIVKSGQDTPCPYDKLCSGIYSPLKSARVARPNEKKRQLTGRVGFI